MEHLRLAQEKINNLEDELEELRRENDEIMSVADTFKALSEEYYEQMEKLKPLSLLMFLGLTMRQKLRPILIPVLSMGIKKSLSE
jgi:prefoldin subunit 5